MPEEKTKFILSRVLWEQGQPLFVVMDAARMPVIQGHWQERCPDFMPLYGPETANSLRDVTPYLGSFGVNRDLLESFVLEGWGQSWGVFLKCGLHFQSIRRHLSRFLKVKTEKQEVLYFRFYDPRVLRVFLPTCTEDQLEEFFGPIEEFWAESEAANEWLVFTRQNGKLCTQIVSADHPTFKAGHI